MSSTTTSNCCPTFNSSLGCPSRPHVMSVTCSKPSMPSRSINAPKSVMFLTVPTTRSKTSRTLALFAALLFDHLASAEHDVLSVVIEFNDFEIVSVPDELLQILWWNDINLGGRQECLDANVHHQSAFDDRSHFTFDKAVTLENVNDLVPVLAVGRFLLRKHHHAFFVFQSLQENVDLVANLQRLGIFKFAQRNDALGLVSDIDEHFAWTNFQNLPFDDASFAEVRHWLRHHVLHLNHKVSRPPLQYNGALN